MKRHICCDYVINNLLSNILIRVFIQFVKYSCIFTLRNFKQGRNMMIFQNTLIIVNGCQDRSILYFKHIVMSWMINVVTRSSDY